MVKKENKELTQAVALKYDVHENAAPKIIAKGKGVTAEKIMQTALGNSVPVYQNKALTQMLMALELDSEIPPELYQAVAEVLSYVYRADKLLGLSKSLNEVSE